MQVAEGVVVAGRYRLEKPLARGGMGSVWFARHLQLDSMVAVKFMDANIAASLAREHDNRRDHALATELFARFLFERELCTRREQQDLSALGLLFVRSESGNLIPLKSVATLSKSVGPVTNGALCKALGADDYLEGIQLTIVKRRSSARAACCCRS